MDRLLKLVQHRNNIAETKQQHHDPIFDVRTYQKNFLENASLDYGKYKRMSFSQYSHTSQKKEYTFKGQKVLLKQEIKPHKSKQQGQVTDLFKEKIKEVKNTIKKNKQERDKDNMTDHILKDKKSSQSAYITARKKIFQKQSAMGATSISQIQFSKYQTQNKWNNLEVFIQSKEKDILLLKPTVFQPQNFEEKINEEQEPPENKITLSQRRKNIKYLERIVTDDKRNIKKEFNELNLISSRFNDTAKTQVKKKSFLTGVKKKKSAFDFMINSPKSKSKPQVEPEKTNLSICIKNFMDQKQIQEEEINIFPEATAVQIRPNQIKAIYKQPKDDITSKCASIFHVVDGQIVSNYAMNQKQKVEIASITKIMTCYLILTLSQKFGLDVKRQRLMVSQRASRMQGTSAKLAYSDISTVYQMLHGLMLPSGNDAAIALGEWGGKTIRRYSALLKRMRPTQNVEKSDRSITLLLASSIQRKSYLKLFIHHMNKIAQFLQLKSTNFANTHGLMNQKAYSCSQDVALLTYHAMKHPMIRQIVGKISFKCKIFNRTFSHYKDYVWDNTNKLLSMDGFVGVKTGVTPAAGPCLSSMFEVSSSQYFIIVVLKTKSCLKRFKETVDLLRKIMNKVENTNSSKYYNKSIESLEGNDKIDITDVDNEMQNDCRQSTTSNSDKGDDDDFDLPDMLT